MSFRSVVAGLVGRPDAGPLRECRRCGTTVEEAEREACPQCGAEEIAVYDVV